MKNQGMNIYSLFFSFHHYGQVLSATCTAAQNANRREITNITYNYSFLCVIGGQGGGRGSHPPATPRPKCYNRLLAL